MKFAWMMLAMLGLVVGLGPALAQPSGSRPTLTMRKEAPAHGGFVDDMDCSACHTTSGWQLASTAGASGFDHDRTGFALRGGHAQATCSRCHTGGARPPTRCEGCHKDPHEGRLDGTCAECHSAQATAWSDTRALEQHRRTRMPLTGRHALIDCTSCHLRQTTRTFRDLPVDCYSCHRSKYHDHSIHPVHDGSTGQPAFARECGLCHQTTSWTPAFTDPTKLPGEIVARTGGHDRWFVLSSGKHTTAPCESCHVDPKRTAQVRCDGCHADATLRREHAGATVAHAAPACLRCHPRGGAR